MQKDEVEVLVYIELYIMHCGKRYMKRPSTWRRLSRATEKDNRTKPLTSKRTALGK